FRCPALILQGFAAPPKHLADFIQSEFRISMPQREPCNIQATHERPFDFARVSGAEANQLRFLVRRDAVAQLLVWRAVCHAESCAAAQLALSPAIPLLEVSDGDE